LGFRVQGLRLEFRGGFRVWVLGLEFGIRVMGSRFRV
jgi:hypothetical protein